jgi:hypothetical protein
VLGILHRTFWKQSVTSTHSFFLQKSIVCKHSYKHSRKFCLLCSTASARVCTAEMGGNRHGILHRTFWKQSVTFTHSFFLQKSIVCKHTYKHSRKCASCAQRLLPGYALLKWEETAIESFSVFTTKRASYTWEACNPLGLGRPPADAYRDLLGKTSGGKFWKSRTST